jgi:signal transduction histidine kinase
MPQTNASDIRENLFAGAGKLDALLRSQDWSQTPLGAVAEWPHRLVSTVSLVLNSPSPMVIFWGPHRVPIANEAYQAILGTPPATLEPTTVQGAEGWAGLASLVDQVIATGQAMAKENQPLFSHRHGYCEETYISFFCSPLGDEGKPVAGVLCTCTETTHQVLGARRLRTLHHLATQAGTANTTTAACESALQTLAHNTADIPFALLYQLDESGRYAHLTGRTGLAEQISASPAHLDRGAEEGGDPWPLAEILHTATPVRLDDVIDRCGELTCGPWSEPPTTALALPITAPGHERPTGMMVVGISPRRALDDDYQGFLELVARQIAAALAEARTGEVERQRAEALTELEEAKTDFFSQVSAEFSTPLTRILVPTAAALADLDYPLPPRQRQRLETIHSNGLRLLKLVNILLDFSYIEDGRLPATYEPTDLSALTTDLAQAFCPLVEQAGLDLQVHCPSLPAPVYVDREMWEKIVLNLLSNAFKFTLAGEISVALRWCETEAEVIEAFRAIQRSGPTGSTTEPAYLPFSCPYPSYSPTVLLTIRDTGSGIPAPELPRLFERFHRVETAQGRSLEGTGIGLSLVQELVKLHGGSVSVTSELNGGSSFTIAIPAGYGHLPSDRLRHASDPSRSERGHSPLHVAPYLEEARNWLSHPSP